MTESAGGPSPAPLPYERRAQVVDLLRRRGVVRADELAAELDVSVITIRRDIALLASQGVMRRVRGGAVMEGADERDAPVVPQPATVAGRRLTVGVVVPSLTYYYPDVIRGVREAAAAASARVVLRGATYQADDERRQLAWLVESMEVDGLLVAPTTTGEEGEALVRWLHPERGMISPAEFKGMLKNSRYHILGMILGLSTTGSYLKRFSRLWEIFPRF